MADAPATSPATSRVVTASIFVATIAGVLLTTGSFLSLDVFLARIDRRESTAHAASEYAVGAQLMRDGHANAAAERFGAAVATDRSNISYALALGEAMLDVGRTADAEATLKTLLERAENDGAVNLTMAHVMQREGRTEEAKAYLHRAVFGRWGADSVARRRQARFELIDLLARLRAPRELLAELLPFEETPPDSVVLRRRLGHLFILAGSPGRAANMFREVLRRDPGDAEAYAGMGDAELALGNFRTARTDLAEAARLRPGDSEIAGRLAVADTVLALDPTARGIGLLEEYTRSRALLARTIATVGACDPSGASVADSARVLLAHAPAVRGAESLIGAMEAMAIDVWAARPPSCTSASRDEALRLVQDRIAQ